MKLNSTQVKQTLSQFDAEVLPDDHPAVTHLSEMQAQTGEVVSLADWSDATLTSLKPHEPELTGVVIVLERKH
jgi:hypothetical protein